jgi:hypothetical protein
MQKILAQLWTDDNGALLASEWLFLATILVIGEIVGLANLRTAVNVELSEFGNALMAVSQGFFIAGQVGCGATVDGSQAIDNPALVNPITSAGAPLIPSVIDLLPCQ